MKRMMMVFLLTACHQTESPDLGPGAVDMARAPLAVVVTSDFTSGGLSTLDLTQRTVQKNLDKVDA